MESNKGVDSAVTGDLVGGKGATLSTVNTEADKGRSNDGGAAPIVA